MVRRKAIIMIAAVVLGGGGWSRADTFHFQQGAADPCHPEFGIYTDGHDLTIADTSIPAYIQWVNNNPNRLRTKYQSGAEKFNALVRFEGIENILQERTVIEARISLTYQHENVAWAPATIDVHPLSKTWDDPNCDWDYADKETSLLWDVPGAQHDPNDRGALISSTAMGYRAGYPVWIQYDDGKQYHFPLSGEILERWINEPESNNGVIIIMNHAAATDVTFSSNEDSDSTTHPMLTVETCMTIPADINRDCYVEFDDLEILAGQWLQEPGIPSADIAPEGGDNIVDMLDFALLANQWLACSDPSNENCLWGDE